MPDPTLRDDLLGVVDELRDLPDEFGIRRFQAVTLRRRKWSGGSPGLGTATNVDLVLSPVPRVRILSTAEVLASEGSYEQGDYQVDKITPRYLDGTTYGGYYPTAQLATPTAPTIAPQGTVGMTPYGYKIIPLKGTTTCGSVSPQGVTSTGNATLSATNYNRVSWTAISGATSYLVYRTATMGSPATTGLLGETAGTSFNDTGIAGDGTVAAPPCLQLFVAATATDEDTCLLMTGDDGEVREFYLKSANFDRPFGYTLIVGKTRTNRS